MSDEKQARAIASRRQARQRDTLITKITAATNVPDLLQQIAAKKKITASLNLVLKTDVQGSAEALRHAIAQLVQEKATVNVIASGIGGISASDVQLAIASHAIIVGFNVRANAEARVLIEANHVQVYYHNIIYDVVETIRKIINAALEDIIQERTIGLAEIRSLFRSSKSNAIAGCIVLEGVIRRHQPIRVLRDHVVIFTGTLESLRRFKDDVNEVRAGLECGIAIKNYHDLREGDKIEIFERVAIKQEI